MLHHIHIWEFFLIRLCDWETISAKSVRERLAGSDF